MKPRTLQHEIKKKHPFDSPEQEALLNLLRTSDRFSFQLERLFRAHGLTSPQYNILRILRGEGDRLPCLEIASRMVAMVPAITALIDRLTEVKLVVRERSEEDRRVIYIGLTEKGRKALAELDGPVADLHHRLLGHLPSSELRELSRLLTKARASLLEAKG